MLRAAITALLVPPANLAVIGLLACLVAGRGMRGRRARRVAILCLGGLVLLSLPVVASALLASLDPGPAPSPASPPAAIVVLGGDVQRVAEAPGVEIGPLTLERVRTGAALARATHLPLLVSGGVVDRTALPVATLMQTSLEEDFKVAVRWQEAVSFDTWENAERSAAMLRADGVQSVFVVTHAWHMRRAVLAFRRHGMAAVPAPVRRDRWPGLVPTEFLPRASAWLTSYFALHEWAGLAWYSVRG